MNDMHDGRPFNSPETRSTPPSDTPPQQETSPDTPFTREDVSTSDTQPTPLTGPEFVRPPHAPRRYEPAPPTEVEQTAEETSPPSADRAPEPDDLPESSP